MFAIIDDTDPGLVYSGNWRVLTDPVNPLAPEYKSTTHVTNDPTASVSYQFHGTMLSAFGTIDTPATKGYPSATFSISPNNIVPPTRLNQTGDIPWLHEPNTATTHIQLFKSATLPLADYTMTLKADGATASAPFYLDFLTVQVPDDSATTVERAIVDDAGNTQWIFQGTWNTGNIMGNYLTTLHQSQDPGGSSVLSFSGTDITVYGTLNGGYSTRPLAYFQVDGGENHVAYVKDIPNDSIGEGKIRRNQMIWSIGGLSAGSHTLSMVIPPNTAATPGNPPLFIDYAVYGPVTGSGGGGDSGGSGTGTGTGTGSSSSGASSASGASATGTASGSLTGNRATPLSAGSFTFNNEGAESIPGSSSTTQAIGPIPLASTSSPPTVAIAGGVVGGVAVLLILVAFLLWRKRRARKRARQVIKFEESGFPLDAPHTPSSGATASPYTGELMDGSKDALVGRMSIRKGGGRRWREESTVLDDLGSGTGSPLSSRLPFHGSMSLGTASLVTGTNGSGSGSSGQARSSTLGSTVVSEEQSSGRGRVRGGGGGSGRVRGPRREMDGGVRLASASDDDEEEEVESEVLPPSYARYR